MNAAAQYNFSVPLTADGLVAEVAGGTFCFNNRVKAANVKAVWDRLGFFVAETLKQQKGVLLPNLGTFRVGPVVGESVKKIRPSFTLLEGRYGGVSQERPKFVIGGKAPIVQPNYGLLSSSASVHRGVGQRVIAELLQRLGVHILSQRPIKLEFPMVGKLLTNRVGRIEFVFDPLFAEHFERESFAVVKEMQYGPADYEKGLQYATLEDPPLIKSPRNARPVSAVSGVSRRERMREQVHAPYKGSLQELYKRCRAADRIASGCVPRLSLEQWLHTECRPTLALLDGATLMDLLDRHTYGKTTKQILYTQFLDSLDAALEGSTGQQRAVASEPSPAPQHPQPAGRGELEPRLDMREASAQDLVLQPTPGPSTSEPSEYAHYCQHQLSPRSRADFDAFNRVHFGKLHQGRMAARRAVTPKVGEEPLNVQEYQAVRSASPQGPRGRTPAMVWPSQQQQQQQHHYPQHQQAWAAPRGGPAGPSQALPPRASAPHPPQVMHILHPEGSPPSAGNAGPDRQRGYDILAPTPLPHAHKAAAGSSGPPEQGYDILAPPPPPPTAPGRSVEHSSPGEASYDILAPPPLPLAARPAESSNQPFSQYDIDRQADPVVKARMKEEYAAGLQHTWDEQIREKQELEGVLEKMGQRWPFGPVHVPMDKRPVNAISRPWSAISPPRSPRRPHALKSPR